MNKKKLFAILIIITLIILSFIGGSTFAKYITVNKEIGEMHVAHWSIQDAILANGKTTPSNTINLAKTYDPETLVRGKIAPGTCGNFGIWIDAKGAETGIDYKLSFENVPDSFIENLIFSYNGKDYDSLQSLSEDLQGNIPANAIERVVNLEVEWSWPYETFDSENSCKDGDYMDTEYGTRHGYYQCEFDIVLTITQEAPKEKTT